MYGKKTSFTDIFSDLKWANLQLMVYRTSAVNSPPEAEQPQKPSGFLYFNLFVADYWEKCGSWDDPADIPEEKTWAHLQFFNANNKEIQIFFFFFPKMNSK